MLTIISYFFLLFNQDTPKTKAIEMTQRRWAPTFGPAPTAILTSHDCCNSADSNTIIVFTCTPWPTPALPWVTARAATRFLCSLVSPAHKPADKGFLCPLASMITEFQVHKPFHSAVGVTRPGCSVAVLTWPPKAIKNQLSHQTKLSKLLLCLEMVAQWDKTAAYKPLPFFLLLTFPGQLVYVLEKVFPRNQG